MSSGVVSARRGWIIGAGLLGLLAGLCAFGWRTFSLLREVRSEVTLQSKKLEAITNGQQVLLNMSARTILDRPTCENTGGTLGGGRTAVSVASSPKVAPIPNDETPQEKTPQMLAAEQRAQTVIEGAIARGSWTEQDRNEFREQKFLLTPARLQANLDQLILAGNAGKVRIEVRGMLF